MRTRSRRSRPTVLTNSGSSSAITRRTASPIRPRKYRSSTASGSPPGTTRSRQTPRRSSTISSRSASIGHMCQPIGPKTLDGVDATRPPRCTSWFSHDVAGGAYDPRAASLARRRLLRRSAELKMESSPGTLYHRVRFYPIDEAGRCGSSRRWPSRRSSTSWRASTIRPRVHHEQGAQPTWPGCETLSCWTVTGISDRRSRARRYASRFSYTLWGREQGSGRSTCPDGGADPPPLEGRLLRSASVTFSWELQPGCSGPCSGWGFTPPGQESGPEIVLELRCVRLVRLLARKGAGPPTLVTGSGDRGSARASWHPRAVLLDGSGRCVERSS